jgi:outer membrane protein
MKRLLTLAIALFAGLTLNAAAQTAPTPAGPVKVAVIAFQAAVSQTNEFQRDLGDLQKKFEPKRVELKTLSDEIDALTKQLQAPGGTEADRATKSKSLEDKKKKAQRLSQDAQGDFQQALQQVFTGVASKVADVMSTYAKDQNITMVIDETETQQASPVVLYANPSSDITKAVIEAYNTKSGVSAPPAQPAAGPKPAGK